MSDRKINEGGNRYGHLTVIKENGRTSGGKVKWECICDCGATTMVPGTALRRGSIKSCGCQQGSHLKLAKNRADHRTHNLTHHSLYEIWHGMKKRCTNPIAENYQYYGGKGISVCLEWQNFQTFYDDMIEQYNQHVSVYGKKNTWIDRKDNNGGYNKANCKFSTILEQSNNKSNNRKFPYQGQFLTVPAIARAVGIQRTYLYKRLVLGHTVEEIIDMRKTMRKGRTKKMFDK